MSVGSASASLKKTRALARIRLPSRTLACTLLRPKTRLEERARLGDALVLERRLMEAADDAHGRIAARTSIMSTPSGAYKIWRHPHLKLVDKCLQYVIWLAMRLDKLDSVAKLAGPEGATARRRMVQFNAGAAARFAAKHWTTTVETTPEGVELIVYSPKEVDSPVPVVLWIHGGGFTIGGARDAFGAELCAAPPSWRAAGRPGSR